MPDQLNLERRPWWSTPSSALIAAFLWIVFTDPIAQLSFAFGRLSAAIIGALIAAALSTAVFVIAAGRGYRARQPSMVVSGGAFGERGALLVPGLLMAMVQILWFAAAVHYAVEFTLRGLISIGLLSESSLTLPAGVRGIIQSPVYRTTALVWGLAAAAVSTHFLRWISGLMTIFPVFCAVIYGGLLIWALPAIPSLPESSRNSGSALIALFGMIQFVTGFSINLAAQSVEWGMVLRGRRDVLIGGVVAVGMPAAILSILVLMIVAGHLSRLQSDSIEAVSAIERAALAPNLDDYTIGAVLEEGIGGRLGGAGLLILGLASMASAVYAANSFATSLSARQSRIKKWGWSLIGAVIAFPIMITGIAGNISLVVDLTAGVLGPWLGVMAADLVSRRERWTRPSTGYEMSGMLGWGIGSLIGFAPALVRLFEARESLRAFPAAPLGVVVAFLVVQAVERLKRPTPKQR